MASRILWIKGTPHQDGSYTVVTRGPKAMRKLALAVFARADRKREIISRTDRDIHFGPRKES